MKPLKLYKRRRWKLQTECQSLWFFTCARPGRTADPRTKFAPIPDDTVHRWVLGLPGPATAIVSLLGWKPDGTSEFSFYSFCGGFELASDSRRLSFGNWLDKHHGDLAIAVCEHPTWDFKAIPAGDLDAISTDIRRLAAAGRTVVLIDSGGETRTGQVCKHMNAVPDSSTASPISRSI